MGDSESYRFLQLYNVFVDCDGKELLPSEPESARLSFSLVVEAAQNGPLFVRQELPKWNGLG
jgi:hypothetical protein